MIFIWLSKYIFQYVYKLEINNLWSKITRMYVSCECGSFPDRISCRCGLYEIRTLSDHTLALLIHVHVPDRLTNMPVWTHMYIAKDNLWCGTPESLSKVLYGPTREPPHGRSKQDYQEKSFKSWEIDNRTLINCILKYNQKQNINSLKNLVLAFHIP